MLTFIDNYRDKGKIEMEKIKCKLSLESVIMLGIYVALLFFAVLFTLIFWGGMEGAKRLSLLVCEVGAFIPVTVFLCSPAYHSVYSITFDGNRFMCKNIFGKYLSSGSISELTSIAESSEMCYYMAGEQIKISIYKGNSIHVLDMLRNDLKKSLYYYKSPSYNISVVIGITVIMIGLLFIPLYYEYRVERDYSLAMDYKKGLAMTISAIIGYIAWCIFKPRTWRFMMDNGQIRFEHRRKWEDFSVNEIDFVTSEIYKGFIMNRYCLEVYTKDKSKITIPVPSLLYFDKFDSFAKQEGIEFLRNA